MEAGLGERGLGVWGVKLRTITTLTLKSRFFGIFSLEKKMSSRSPGLFERSDPAFLKAGQRSFAERKRLSS
jgi:hypothetical protein